MKIVWYTLMLSLGLASLLYASEPKDTPTPSTSATTKPMNSIMVIHPYKHSGMRVFDDEAKGQWLS